LADEISRMVLDGIGSAGMRGRPITIVAPDPVAPAKGETREAILRSAARLIRDRGYTAATLRAIAAGAGMEAGSIYYHFGSKSVILDEVLDRGLREMQGGLAARVAAPCQSPVDHRARLADAI